MVVWLSHVSNDAEYRHVRTERAGFYASSLESNWSALAMGLFNCWYKEKARVQIQD